MQIGLVAEQDVDGDHLDVEFLLPGRRHVGRAVGHDAKHLSLSFQVPKVISQLVSQREQRAVIQALYGALAPSHDLADLGVRKVLHEFEDQQCLPLGRQLTDQPHQRFLLLRPHQPAFRSLFLGDHDRQVAQRDLLLAAAIPVPIGHQVVRYPIQPGGERHTAVCVVVNVVHRPLEHTGREVLRVVQVAGAIVNVVVDAFDVDFVQGTERFAVAPRSAPSISSSLLSVSGKG